MKGKAYALFDCDRTIDAIRNEVKSIRRVIEVPSDLEVLLFSRKDFVSGSVLSTLTDQLGLGYVAEATYPGYSNKDAADELSVIFNQAANSPLYDNPEDFRGEIIYRDINSWARSLFMKNKSSLGYVFYE